MFEEEIRSESEKVPVTQIIGVLPYQFVEGKAEEIKYVVLVSQTLNPIRIEEKATAYRGVLSQNLHAQRKNGGMDGKKFGGFLKLCIDSAIVKAKRKKGE